MPAIDASSFTPWCNEVKTALIAAGFAHAAAAKELEEWPDYFRDAFKRGTQPSQVAEQVKWMRENPPE